MDYWTVAECDLNNSRPDFNATVDGYHPELCQGPWKTLVDGSLENYDLARDETMAITMGKCSDYVCIDNEPAPDTLCLSKNSVLHSFLEGNYVKTGVTGGDGSVEYVKEKVMYDDHGKAIQPYLYYWYDALVIVLCGDCVCFIYDIFCLCLSLSISLCTNAWTL